jgi:hypothetical protein
LTISASGTRFAGNFLAIRRARRLRPSLRKLVASAVWKDWRDQSAPDAQAELLEAERMINHAKWWDHMDLMDAFGGVVLGALREADRARCSAPYMYHIWSVLAADGLKASLAAALDINVKDKLQLIELAAHDWQTYYTPALGLAYFVYPPFLANIRAMQNSEDKLDATEAADLYDDSVYALVKIQQRL